MKILLVSNVFPPGFIGGYELGAFEVASRLSKLGHEIRVITSDYFLDENNLISGMIVERVLDCPILSHERPTSPSAELEGNFCNWRNIRRLATHMRKNLPDLVMCFNLAGLGPCSIYQFLRACGLPYISYFMDTCFSALQSSLPGPWNEYQKIFGPLQVGEFGTIIAMSRNLVTELTTVITDLTSESVTYVPGWVDTSLICANAKSQKLLGKQIKRFVFCGRVAPHKGTDLVLSACENLIEMNRNDFTVDVYGMGQVTYFLQEVTRRRLNNIVFYKGVLPKEQMLQRFVDYDAMLFPTWEREPFGFTVSEAAAAGCFSIMTNSIGAAEWFFDGVDCLKIERSTRALEASILQVLEMSPEQIRDIQMAAQINAKVNLNVDKWIDVIEGECLKTLELKGAYSINTISQVESSFLVLNDLWRSRLDRR